MFLGCIANFSKFVYYELNEKLDRFIQNENKNNILVVNNVIRYKLMDGYMYHGYAL